MASTFTKISEGSLQGRIISAVFFISTALPQFPTIAQQGNDLGNNVARGQNKVEGRVYYPSGRPVDKRLKITLQSINVPDAFTLSDEQGVFVFSRLPNGTYRLSIDAGKEYEVHYETVNILEPTRRRGDTNETVFSVTVFLKPKANSKESNTVVDAALASAPKPARGLYEKSAQAARDGDKQRAIDLLEQAIKIHPQFAEAFKELGFLYLLTGNPEKAVLAFRRVVQMAPDSHISHLNLGYALLEDNEPAEAQKTLLKAIELDKKSTKALILLAQTQIKLKDYAAAEKALLQVVSLGGTDIGKAYRLLGSLYDDKGDITNTAEFLEKYLNLPSHERDVTILIRLARAQIRLRKLDQAERNLLQAISVGGSEIGLAHRFLGALYNEKGDSLRAIEHLEKYLQLTPTASDMDKIRLIIEELSRRQP